MPKKLWLDLQRSQPAVVELVAGDKSKPATYRIWLTYNKAFTAGTYLLLNANGSIFRMTEDEDGTINATKRIW